MKKLTLLLTSLLLAGAASATVLDFERVETHQDTSINLNQDFQIAHVCGIYRVHVGGKHIHRWVPPYTTHEPDVAQCAQKEWIANCRSQNRVIDTDEGGKCGRKCRNGEVPGEGSDAYKCVRSSGCPGSAPVRGPNGRCISNVKACHDNDMIYFERNGYGNCFKCPGHKPFLDRPNNRCSECPADRPIYKIDTNECLSAVEDKTRYCNGRDEIYVVERDRCEKCAEWHPKRVGNTCNACPGGHSWQAQHKKCVSFADLDAFCRESSNNQMVYSQKTDKCQPCPDHTPHHRPDHPEVCLSEDQLHDANLKYCNNKDQIYIRETKECQACSGSTPHRKANECIADRVEALTYYCNSIGKLYSKVHDACETEEDRINWCNSQNEVYVAERARCEKCAKWHPVRVGNECAPCGPDTSWQEAHGRCVPHAELATFCNSRDEIYVPERDRCERCAPHHPHRGANRCFTDRTEALVHYCSTMNKLYNNTSDQCSTMESAISWCNGRNEIFVAERNRCERCAPHHPLRAGNECIPCPSGQARHIEEERCVPFAELESFCSVRGQWYDHEKPGACIPCPHGFYGFSRFNQESYCVHDAKKCAEQGKAWDVFKFVCVDECPDYRRRNPYNTCTNSHLPPKQPAPSQLTPRL